MNWCRRFSVFFLTQNVFKPVKNSTITSCRLSTVFTIKTLHPILGFTVSDQGTLVKSLSFTCLHQKKLRFSSPNTPMLSCSCLNFQQKVWFGLIIRLLMICLSSYNSEYFLLSFTIFFHCCLHWNLHWNCYELFNFRKIRQILPLFYLKLHFPDRQTAFSST